jgi:hypothetical protein
VRTSDAVMVLLSNRDLPAPPAAFNGFLTIKSMRLFALRTVSIGKPAGAPDVAMRSRRLAAAGRAGRRSCGRGGLAPRSQCSPLACGVADERKTIAGRRLKKRRGVVVNKDVPSRICPSCRNEPMRRKSDGLLGAMRGQTPFVFWFAE